MCAAALLRFSRLDLMEFRGDQADHHEALLEIREGHLPLCGHVASSGMMFPPWFYYALVPGLALGRSPMALAAVCAASGVLAVLLCWLCARRFADPTVAFAAAMLMATSPWAVMESRKLWAPDMMPFFSALALWCCLRFLEKPSAGRWTAALLALCVGAQVHYSGLPLLATALLTWWLTGWRIPWKWWLGAGAACAVSALPFIVYEIQHGFRDVAILLGLAAGSGGGALSLRGFRMLPDLIGGAGLAQFYMAGMTSSLSAAYRPAVAIATALGGILIAGGIAESVRRLRGGGPVEDSAEGTVVRSGAQIWLLLAWVVLPPLLLFREPVHRCYFFVCMPAMWVVAAAGLQRGMEIASRAPGRAAGARALACAVVSLTALAGVWTSAEILFSLARAGGTYGPYGPTYGTKMRIADFLADRSREEPVLLLDLSFPPLVRQAAQQNGEFQGLLVGAWAGGIPHLAGFIDPEARFWQPGQPVPGRVWILTGALPPSALIRKELLREKPLAGPVRFGDFELAAYGWMDQPPPPTPEARRQPAYPPVE